MWMDQIEERKDWGIKIKKNRHGFSIQKCKLVLDISKIKKYLTFLKASYSVS